MSKHYSFAKKGFYDDNIHAVLPDDAVAVSDAEYSALLKGINSGQQVIQKDNGKPQLLPPAPSPYHKWSGSAWIVDTSKKQEVITVLTARIDNEMEAKILSDFEFAGKKFYLDDKNQFKYKAEYDIRENLTYPHRVKCVDGYYDIQTAEEHQAWYLGGLQFVRACEVTAWSEVDALQNKTTAELIELLNT